VLKESVMDKEEELLIKRAQRGNLQAFESLVQRYDAKIMRLIFNMLNDVEDTRDIYQEVFIKVFKSLKKFSFQSEFYTWLYRIAINTCINFRKQRISHQYDSLDEILEGNDRNWRIYQDIESRNPENYVLNLELSFKIQQAIDQLSKKQKAVLVLRHYHGYKLSEIAEIMGSSEGTIKNYLFRAVQKMKKSLEEYHHI